MEDKSGFKIYHWYELKKENSAEFWSWLSLFRAEKRRFFFTHILYKRVEKHAVDYFPGTSWIKQYRLHYDMRLIMQIISGRKKVKLRIEWLLHNQWARVRSDGIVFQNGFIQIQLSAVDLHLHAAVKESSY